jgi:hypothetical protein
VRLRDEDGGRTRWDGRLPGLAWNQKSRVAFKIGSTFGSAPGAAGDSSQPQGSTRFGPGLRRGINDDSTQTDGHTRSSRK